MAEEKPSPPVKPIKPAMEGGPADSIIIPPPGQQTPESLDAEGSGFITEGLRIGGVVTKIDKLPQKLTKT